MAKTAKKEAAANPMGLKRICTNCGARFYDMNKRPIICPSCETEFTGEVKVKSRRGRAAAVADEPKVIAKEAETPVNENEDEDILEEDEGVEVVSLDDAEDAGDDEDDTILGDEDNLDDIPDLGDDDIDDLGDDDDTLLVEDDD